MQASSVVEVVNLDLAFLGQLNGQHVHWKVELGLGLVEVLLVQGITSILGGVQSQHEQRVTLDVEGTNVMANLLAVSCLVLVLIKKRINHSWVRVHNSTHRYQSPCTHNII